MTPPHIQILLDALRESNASHHGLVGLRPSTPVQTFEHVWPALSALLLYTESDWTVSTSEYVTMYSAVYFLTMCGEYTYLVCTSFETEFERVLRAHPDPHDVFARLKRRAAKVFSYWDRVFPIMSRQRISDVVDRVGARILI